LAAQAAREKFKAQQQQLMAFGNSTFIGASEAEASSGGSGDAGGGPSGGTLARLRAAVDGSQDLAILLEAVADDDVELVRFKLGIDENVDPCHPLCQVLFFGVSNTLADFLSCSVRPLPQ
jgi:hypothetical protein